MEEYTNEEWRDVAGYEGLYMVSNYGRVKSLDRRNNINQLVKGRIMKLEIHKSGYVSVGLSKNGFVKRCLVHRLVGQAFIPNPDNYPQIDHKDSDPLNNNVSNIRWVTPSQNVNTEHRRSLVIVATVNGKNSKPVLQYTLDGEFVREWPSTMEIQRVLGFSNGSIGRVCRGEYRQSNGYLWRYKNSEK